MAILKGLRRRATNFWHELARPVDYPHDEDEWLALIDQPVRLTGPFDWGMAISPMVTGKRTPGRSPLGNLLWSYKHREDEHAAEILSAVLVRFLERCQVQDDYDGLIVVPPSFQSRPRPPVDSLLDSADRELPLPVLNGAVTRSLAIAPQAEKGSDTPREGRDQAIFTVDSAVSGKRILLIDDFYNTGETIGALVHALREQGASKVGVVTICSGPRVSHD